MNSNEVVEGTLIHGTLNNSVIKQRRGVRTQQQIAQATGVSQSFLSELESGSKQLTLYTAERLAPALGTTPDQLLHEEQVETLKRVAQQGNIDPEILLKEAERLDEILPGGEIGEAILVAMMAIVFGHPCVRASEPLSTTRCAVEERTGRNA